MSDVIEVLYKDTIVVESGDNKVIVIEPKVIINQSTDGGEWGTITGDIGEQSDLIAELAKKMDVEPMELPSETDIPYINGVYIRDGVHYVRYINGNVMTQLSLEAGNLYHSISLDGGTSWCYEKRIASEDDLTTLSLLFDTKVDKVAGKGLSTNDYTNDEKLLLTTDRFRINATDFIGGTASPYQGIVIGGVPVIVKKFLNQNSYYYTTVRLPSDSVYLDNIRFILTESVMPTAGQYIDFTINGTSLRHSFNGTEVQNQMITTNVTIGYDDVGNQVNTLTISGTYLQKIGIVSMDFFYSRGV